MLAMSRSPIIAGNWKMYKTIAQALSFVKTLPKFLEDTSQKVYLAAPFTSISQVAQESKGTSIVIGAQNMNDASEGAFTGEIAAKMLVDAGAKFVILGHSERRHIFQEDDAFINMKVKKALSEGLQVILCIGETLKEREGGQTRQVLQKQLQGSLQDVHPKEGEVVVAYEPVWAIGTGQTASPEMAQETHKECRDILSEILGEELAQKTVLQYGGSVKPENVKVLMSQPDIDGVLVGGASLDPEVFAKIANYQS